jgi:hypothetical protein
MTILLALFIGLNLSAQDTTSVQQSADTLAGEAKNYATKIVFKNMMYKEIPISGLLKPNMSMTKYQVDISGNGLALTGIINSKELKTSFDLSFDGQPITGEMKLPLAGENYKWNVSFLNSDITGGIKLNVMHTKATFNLKSDKYNVTGEVKDKTTSVYYNININGKSIKGKIKTQMDHDLTYKLSLDHLKEDELALFFLIESIRIIALDKESADKFQNGSGF